jgi:uncharacterized membrane protein YbhN (UPF0104 family)
MRLPTSVRRWAPRLFGAGLIVCACLVLWREVRALDAGEVAAYMRAWGAWRIVLASGLAATNFALVAAVEWLGLRWSGAPLPWRMAALRSFMVNGLIHSLGANVVTAALTRSWVYRRTGIRLLTSATVTAFAAVTLFAGLAVLVGCALLSSSPQQLQGIRLEVGPARVGGGLLLGVVVAYLAACARWPSARLFRDVRLPSFAYGAAQVAIGAVDNLISSALLWLLVGRPAPPYPAFAVAYVLAYLAGLLSTAPGGVGVFEAALFLLLPQSSRASLAAGFMGFRLIFYLAPLIVALALVLAELLRRPGAGDRRARPVGCKR